MRLARNHGRYRRAAWAKHACALLTEMDQPLGRMAGHATEVIESIEVLKGRGPQDLAN